LPLPREKFRGRLTEEVTDFTGILPLAVVNVVMITIGIMEIIKFHDITILPVRFSMSTLSTAAPNVMPEPSGKASGFTEIAIL
jgi:ABC-type uncharacterized transport system permease subunit